MIDWVILVWCASSISVLGIAAVGVWDGIADHRSLDGISNGRRILARGYLVLQAGLMAIGILWTYLGIPRVFDGNLTPLSEPVAILIASNVILAVISGVFLWVRRRLLA